MNKPLDAGYTKLFVATRCGVRDLQCRAAAKVTLENRAKGPFIILEIRASGRR